MRVHDWMMGVYALLMAGAAQGEEAAQVYAEAGDWELSRAPFQPVRDAPFLPQQSGQ
jgi:hypothetical protein